MLRRPSGFSSCSYKNMLADCLTKSSAPPDALMQAVNTGRLPEADMHQPFREMMLNKHKHFLFHGLLTI